MWLRGCRAVLRARPVPRTVCAHSIRRWPLIANTLRNNSTDPPSSPGPQGKSGSGVGKDDKDIEQEKPQSPDDNTRSQQELSSSILTNIMESSGEQADYDNGSKGGKAGYVSSAEQHRERMAQLTVWGFGFAALLGAIYQTREFDDEKLKAQYPDAVGYTPSAIFTRLKARVSGFYSFYQEPAFDKLLPDPLPEPYHRPYTLVLELDDVLIHSQWSREHGWRTAKRPGLDYFLGYLSQYYEIVIFTNQYAGTAAPILMQLDPYHSFLSGALFRESAKYENGKFIKDLSYMNRPESKIVLVDAKPEAWSKQPNNAIKLRPWNGDPSDRDLVGLIPFLESMPAMEVQDVRSVIETYDGTHVPTEYAKREQALRDSTRKRWEEDQKRRSHSGLGSLLGGSKSSSGPPPLLLDQQRQRAQAAYAELQTLLREKGPAMLEEEKQREKEQQQQMKTSLSDIFVHGLPKPPDAPPGEQKQQ